MSTEAVLFLQGKCKLNLPSWVYVVKCAKCAFPGLVLLEEDRFVEVYRTLVLQTNVAKTDPRRQGILKIDGRHQNERRIDGRHQKGKETNHYGQHVAIHHGG